MEFKLATIKCKHCDGEFYIKNWRVGINDLGKLVRLCPVCEKEVEI